MDNNQIHIELKNIRAVAYADVILDGITVITGENGSGKSTISKLTYNLLKTSIEFDDIVDAKLRDSLDLIYETLDQLTMELSYFLNKDEYREVRNIFKKLYKDKTPLNLFEDENYIVSAIDYLIDKFDAIAMLQNTPELSRRFERIKSIISTFYTEKIDHDTSASELLKKIKGRISLSIKVAIDIKESRYVSILNEALAVAFYDNPLPKTFNIYEYGVPVIDRENNKLIPIHSIRNVAYIDTPMITGIDLSVQQERSHWKDLNELLTRKTANKTHNEIDAVFKEEVLKGDISPEEREFSNKSFVYKRNDGKEFDLLECATGLKSFAILQMLYKNGFFNNKHS